MVTVVVGVVMFGVGFVTATVGILWLGAWTTLSQPPDPNEVALW